MPEQPTHVDVPVYLLVEPTWRDHRYSWNKDDQGRQILDGAKVVKATQKRPSVGPKGGVITKITMRFEAGAFLPLQPEAIVVIGVNDSETIVVTTEAPEPDDGDSED